MTTNDLLVRMDNTINELSRCQWTDANRPIASQFLAMLCEAKAAMEMMLRDADHAESVAGCLLKLYLDAFSVVAEHDKTGDVCQTNINVLRNRAREARDFLVPMESSL